MSRGFGTAGANSITITGSASVPVNQGNLTVMCLIKITANLGNDQWFIQGVTSANAAVWGILISGSKFYCPGNFGAGNGTPILNKWMWVGFSKATGSVKPRWHFHNLTDATAWSHVDDGSTVGDQSGTVTKVIIGGQPGNTNGIRGSEAAVGYWSSVLTDAQIETACANGTALAASSLAGGHLLNQASTATAVTDISGHGATQSAITGTTVDADEPPGWAYSAAPSGPTVKLWDGTAEQTLTVKLWDGTSEVTLNLDSIV